jgi:hypothetical protein
MEWMVVLNRLVLDLESEGPFRSGPNAASCLGSSLLISIL